MNFNKKFKGQVQHSATINVNANPLTGITTSFDGIMVNANKRFLIGFPSPTTQIGGTWFDISGGGTNATLNSVPTVGYNPKNGGAIRLDGNGSNTLVQFTPPASLQSAFSTGDFTICVTNETTNLTAPGSQFTFNLSGSNTPRSSRRGFGIGEGDSGNQITILQSDGTAAYQSSVITATQSLNTIYHKTFVVNRAVGSATSVYVNGALVGTASSSLLTGSFYTPGAESASQFGNIAGWKMNGNIYNVLIYNRALTDAEVKQNYNYFGTRFTGIATNTPDYVRSGLSIYYDANDRASLPVSTAIQNGVAGTNTGIICQPNTIYDFPFNQIRNIGVFTTEASTTVNFVLYDAEN
jgi:hypothetical protein